eukprot:Lithocolla_globosa_v1_NODE_10808_length_564_cov_37.459725.p1 type:complete len:160 gc:universal NODE_10808_length_564_cov_37.459725:60-539(+)
MNEPLSKRVFKKYDKDGSGQITSKEFQEMTYDLGHSLNQAQVVSAMKTLDKSGDDQLSYDEFLQWWRNKDRFQTITVSEEDVAAHQNAVTYFAYFDKDRSGSIDKKEYELLYADLRKHGLTTKSLEDSLKVLDANGDGNVSQKEYIDWLISIGSLKPMA